ncbi:hypothetical protein H0H87_011211 [Tephrocybe sp. NHM501043]|nr:hypothetical protein H0H87_011211 [Tephrocybe sp. NHM501043]
MLSIVVMGSDMSSTTSATLLANSLPSSIPKLDPSGSNWAMFALHFEDAVAVKGFWGHFTGASAHPAIPKNSATALSKDVAAAVVLWDKNKLMAKSLLTQKLSDSVLMRIHRKPTIKEH